VIVARGLPVIAVPDPGSLAHGDEVDLLQEALGSGDVQQPKHESIVRAPVRVRPVDLPRGDETERKQQRLDVAAEALGDRAPRDIAVARRPIGLE